MKGEQEVFEICANIDDMMPEDLGAAAEKLFSAGALDVWFEAIQMKKFRPAIKLSILAKSADARRLANEILEQTTAIGVRISRKERITLERSIDKVKTPHGEVSVKRSIAPSGRVKSKAEFDDIKRIAEAEGISVSEVREKITSYIENRKHYRHYKGGEYEYIGIARHSETEEEFVLYRPLYNDSGLWVRPKEMFFEEITINGIKVKRFEEIREEQTDVLH